MAEVPLGPKMLGTGSGVVAAVAYAGDATTVCMRFLGFAVDPAKFEEAVHNLVQGGWISALGAVGLLGGLIAGYFWRKAEARWGSGANTPTV